MARGDNNLLFNPPVIRREASELSPSGRQGNFHTAAKSLIASGQHIILGDQQGVLYLLHEDGPEKLTHNQEGTTGVMAASDSALAWESENGFVVRNKNNPPLLRPALPGNVLGLHLSQTYLYALWSDSEKTHLSKVDIDEHGDENWQEIYDYGSEDMVHMENKGDRTLIYYENNSDPSKIHSAVTLSPFGGGGSVDFFHMKVAGPEPKRLLAPTGSGEAYMALGRTWHNDTELMLLYPHGRVTGRHLGRVEEKTIAPISNLRSTEFKELLSHQGQGLLFANRELVLFSPEEGIKKIIPLPEEIGSRYDRLLFTGARTLLWQEGSSGFFEVNLEGE